MVGHSDINCVYAICVHFLQYGLVGRSNVVLWFRWLEVLGHFICTTFKNIRIQIVNSCESQFKWCSIVVEMRWVQMMIRGVGASSHISNPIGQRRIERDPNNSLSPAYSTTTHVLWYVKNMKTLIYNYIYGYLWLVQWHHFTNYNVFSPMCVLLFANHVYPLMY